MGDYEHISLADQVAVVTGAGRGIGRATALELASRGTAVALIARSLPELDETRSQVEQAGGVARTFPADVTDGDAVRAAFEAIGRTLGPPDLLVNNAGMCPPLRPLLECDVAEWWRNVEVNLRGTMLCSHAALKTMMPRGRGRIVNVSSGGGAGAVRANFSAYVTAKTAVIRFCECLDAETRSHGIAVFAMGPGTVNTAMTDYSRFSPDGKKWLPWFEDIFTEGQDSPVEVPARLVTQFASGRLDALSGRFITIDDDLDALLAQSGTIAQCGLYALRVGRLP